MTILHPDKIILVVVILALVLMFPLCSFAVENESTEDPEIIDLETPVPTLRVGPPETPTWDAPLLLENAPSSNDPEITPEENDPIPMYEVVDSDGYQEELLNDEMHFLLTNIVENQKIMIALMLSFGVVILIAIFCKEWIK